MHALRYQLCDVFTDRPLSGNALAVFEDASGLDARTMQALARELNLSECSFLLPPNSLDADANLRIFTPLLELPFAGHPTLGSAFVIAERTRRASVRLGTARGISSIRFSRDERAAMFGWMTQPLPSIVGYSAHSELLASLGVQSSTLPVELYDNGPHYVMVGLHSPGELAALRPNLGRLEALGNLAAVVFAPLGASWKCRVFAPGEGIAEDPATGAAAGPLALHLCRYGHLAFDSEVRIEQGAEIGRPSLLHARVVGASHHVRSIEVGGHVVSIGRGEIHLPGASM